MHDPPVGRGCQPTFEDAAEFPLARTTALEGHLATGTCNPNPIPIHNLLGWISSTEIEQIFVFDTIGQVSRLQTQIPTGARSFVRAVPKEERFGWI